MLQTSEIVGHIAGFLTTVAFVPQLLRVYRTRQTRDISLGMFVLFTIGVSMWLGYGIAIGSWPVTLANGVTLLLALVILIFKLRYG